MAEMSRVHIVRQLLKMYASKVLSDTDTDYLIRWLYANFNDEESDQIWRNMFRGKTVVFTTLADLKRRIIAASEIRLDC